MLRELHRALRAFFGTDDGERVAAVAPAPPPRSWLDEQLAKLAVGMLREVEQEAAAACRGKPADPEAHYLAGKAALALRDYPHAVSALRRATELAPHRAGFHHDLGLALRELGEKRAALAAFQRAIALQHDHVPAIFHAGQLHAEMGEVEEARDCFTLALAFDPLSSAARIELARLLAESQGVDAAIELLREAVRKEIADVAVLCCLAELLKQKGDTRDAVAAYRAAIERFPDDPAPLVNLGMIRLGHFGDAGEAEALFRRAAELDPTLIEAQANLGLALQEQGRFDEAIEHHERVLAAQPRVAEYRWNRGLANLILGKFGAGWEDYELRKLGPDAGGVHEKFTLPDWDGSPLQGRSLLVYGEQGLGDEIMFASCLPDVIAQAGWCVVECDARIDALYRRSFPKARIEARGRERGRDWRATYPALELQSAVGSLPRYLRRHAADFPMHEGYLVADAEAQARWRARLLALGALPKVGISWRGGTLGTRSGLRSLALEQLAPLLDGGEVTFVVLQRGLSADERAALAQRSNVFIPEAIADVDELAALMSALDLVISVPNTNVHLAGALGSPAWIMLTAAPEWRYLWRGDSMPWYPSARLWRQPRPGDWQTVIKRISDQLSQYRSLSD